MAGATATGGSCDESSFTLMAASITANEPIERGFTWTDRVSTLAGEEIGWDGGRCINLINLVADVKPPEETPQDKWMCEMVFHLPEGDLTTAAPIDFAAFAAGEIETVMFAVTGEPATSGTPLESWRSFPKPRLFRRSTSGCVAHRWRTTAPRSARADASRYCGIERFRADSWSNQVDRGSLPSVPWATFGP